MVDLCQSVAYNNSMKKIKVYRQIESSDKMVHEALRIAENFKVLPYGVVSKILESKASDYSLAQGKK